MSDNNNKNNGTKSPFRFGRKRDSFEKPGDESIVSGGAFFVSDVPKAHKGGNPLLESERRKAMQNAEGQNPSGEKNAKSEGRAERPEGERKTGNQKNRFRPGHGKNAGEEAKSGDRQNAGNAQNSRPERPERPSSSPAREPKNSEETQSRNRNPQNPNPNPNQNPNQNQNPNPENAGRDDRRNFHGKSRPSGQGKNGSGKGRPDRPASLSGDAGNAEKTAENAASGVKGASESRPSHTQPGKGQNPHHGNGKGGNGSDRRGGFRDRRNDPENARNAGNENGKTENASESGAGAHNGAKPASNDRKRGRDDRRGNRKDGSFGGKSGAPEGAERREDGADKSGRPDKSDKSDKFDKRARPKHKKEKFVPSSVPSEGGDGVLNQPIVERAGLVSGSTAGFFRRSAKVGFGESTSSLTDGEEPVLVDRSRPLAEQIAEAEKPKTYEKAAPENGEKVEIVGIRFREAGKIYYFAPGARSVKKGDAVIVETARGVEYGICAIGNRHVPVSETVSPLKEITRLATAEDAARYEENKSLEPSAAKIFREKAAALGLEMELVYVEYTFDRGKLMFYFTADGRVDFRELIKELASAFHTRIELRQIGVRDEAKIVGGLGICGRPVCCKTFLSEFAQVSIKMAKDQNLFINSSKIAGTCGRFMCCIRYEDEVYQKEYERTPKIDAIVETPDGKGVVVESNALKGTVKVLLDDKNDTLPTPYKCSDVKVLGYRKHTETAEEKKAEAEAMAEASDKD